MYSNTYDLKYIEMHVIVGRPPFLHIMNNSICEFRNSGGGWGRIIIAFIVCVGEGGAGVVMECLCRGVLTTIAWEYS